MFYLYELIKSSYVRYYYNNIKLISTNVAHKGPWARGQEHARVGILCPGVLVLRPQT